MELKILNYEFFGVLIFGRFHFHILSRESTFFACVVHLETDF